MKKKYRAALAIKGMTYQDVADKFHTSRQAVGAVINQKSSKGVYGKSKQIKEYLEQLVKDYGHNEEKPGETIERFKNWDSQWWYDLRYLHTNGQRFQNISRSLKSCRDAKDKWLLTLQNKN